MFNMFRIMEMLIENIKHRLNKNKMTVAELERRTGIPYSVVNIIHGKSKNPTVKTIQAIANSLGCKVEDLLESNSIQDQQTNITNNFDYELAIQATQKVTALLKNKYSEFNISADLFYEISKEVTLFAMANNENSVDEKFTTWLIEKKLRAQYES